MRAKRHGGGDGGGVAWEAGDAGPVDQVKLFF